MLNPSEQPATADDIDVDDATKALVKKYKTRIENTLSAHKNRFKRYRANRRLYRGYEGSSETDTEEKPKLVRTNLIFSTVATLYPQIYAKNPDISYSPAETVSDDRYDEIKAFGRTLETIVSRMMVRDAGLKTKAKGWVRSAILCEVGWLKLTFQHDIENDPAILSRIDDAQNNLNSLRASIDKMNEGSGDSDLRIAEAEQMLEALEQERQRTERVIYRGLTLDKLQSEDVLVLDPTIQDFFDYPNAGAIAQRMWFDEEKFEETMGRAPTRKATKFFGKTASNASEREKNTSGGEHDEAFLCVYEIWDKRAKKIYTWCEGEDGWCRPPLEPKVTGRRWYGFFGLCFNPVDGEFYGLSDVDLLVGLQKEYNETREKFADHRRYSVPITVVRAGGSLKPEDIENIKAAQPGDTVVIGGDSSVPLKNDLDSLQGPPIDPALYDVSMIRQDIELVSGASDAARGMIQTPKTATEAEIMQSGLASRTSERQDTVADVISDMAAYASEILIGELTIGEVQRYAGEQAVWPADPTQGKEALFDLLNLDIRAGSTGKPDKTRERDQWTQLMPIIQGMMEKIMGLRMEGQDDMADALVELTRESLRRFDERIDIDAFLPRQKKGDPKMVAQQAQAQAQQLMQENQMLQQAVQELQTQLAELQNTAKSKGEDNAFKASEAEKEREHQRQLQIDTKQIEANKQAATEALSNQKQIATALDNITRQIEQLSAGQQELAAAQQELEQERGEAGAEDIPALVSSAVQQALTPLIAAAGFRPAVVKQAVTKKLPDGSYHTTSTETPGGVE